LSDYRLGDASVVAEPGWEARRSGASSQASQSDGSPDRGSLPEIGPDFLPLAGAGTTRNLQYTCSRPRIFSKKIGDRLDKGAGARLR
jgi:hypothetical protein